MVFVLEPAAGGGGGRGGAGGGGATLSRFDLKTRKSEKLADGVSGRSTSRPTAKRCCCAWAAAAAVAGRGARGAVAAVPHYVIVPSATPVKPGEGALKLADMEVNVDPLAEWKQMYHEVWRIERSYFYDPNLHGVNVADAEKEYEKYLDSLGSRADLNYIIHDMIERHHGRPSARRRRQHSARARPSPADCWARITRSPTAAIASRRSTPARAGTRNCRRRWRSRA